MKNSEAILVTPKQFEIQECPVPEPKDHEILMKVEYVGMCGSDIHGFEFGPFIPPLRPLRMGVRELTILLFVLRLIVMLLYLMKQCSIEREDLLRVIIMCKTSTNVL